MNEILWYFCSPPVLRGPLALEEVIESEEIAIKTSRLVQGLLVPIHL